MHMTCLRSNKYFRAFANVAAASQEENVPCQKCSHPLFTNHCYIQLEVCVNLGCKWTHYFLMIWDKQYSIIIFILHSLKNIYQIFIWNQRIFWSFIFVIVNVIYPEGYQIGNKKNWATAQMLPILDHIILSKQTQSSIILIYRMRDGLKDHI